MAPKAKRTALQLPEIGDVVRITWRDSGVGSDRTGHDAWEVVTSDTNSYGIVSYISDDDIVLTYCSAIEQSEGDNEGHWAIWIPSIQSIKNFGPDDE